MTLSHAVHTTQDAVKLQDLVGREALLLDGCLVPELICIQQSYCVCMASLQKKRTPVNHITDHSTMGCRFRDQWDHHNSGLLHESENYVTRKRERESKQNTFRTTNDPTREKDTGPQNLPDQDRGLFTGTALESLLLSRDFGCIKTISTAATRARHKANNTRGMGACLNRSA